jgi:hypothetical protein
MARTDRLRAAQANADAELDDELDALRTAVQALVAEAEAAAATGLSGGFPAGAVRRHLRRANLLRVSAGRRTRLRPLVPTSGC